MKEKKRLALLIKLLIPIVVLMLVIVLKFTVFTKEKFSIARYTLVKLDGFNTMATAEIMIDESGLLNALMDDDITETERLRYEAFVDTVKCTFDKSKNLSNGDVINITVDYDMEMAKELDIRVGVATREYQVSGLRTGTELDLFADVKIITGGISPFIYVTTINESEDEYLSGLEYSVDKTSGLSIGDKITISCKIDTDRANSLGYYYTESETQYVISTADKYIDKALEIDMELIRDISDENINVIVEETADTTYHMAYRVTQNNSYLFRDGNEEAVGFELGKVLLASNTTGMEQEHENYVLVIYHGSIALPKYTTEADPYDYVDAYFCFKYSDAILSMDGDFLMATNDPHNRYVCAGTYEGVVDAVMQDIGGGYITEEYNDMEEEE